MCVTRSFDPAPNGASMGLPTLHDWLPIEIVAMVLGFIVSFPTNWYLVRAGVKPGM